MKTKTSKRSTKKNIALIGLGLVLAIGAYQIGIASGHEFGKLLKADEISQVLKEECDCEEVNQTMYLKGIQYNKDSGFTTEKADYELINCNYTSTTEGIKIIQKKLNENIKNFKDFDYLSLEFINEGERASYVIKNGIIQ